MDSLAERLLAPFLVDGLSDREREQARWHLERETLELATAGAARVLLREHGNNTWVQAATRADKTATASD